jgi:DNA-binding winged helix-turn-helix (wHTH) protein/tetratricopeptide (TPR) repeat protein
MVLAFWTRRYQSKRADNDAQATMIYRFQDFELDEARLELRRAGVDVAIQARVLRALLYLVRHRDRVVLKDELCDAVWQEIVVSDAALAQVIMHVRKALGDEGEQQTLLKTVRGRGFRFIADVTVLTGTSVAVAAAPALPAQHALLGRASELQTLLGFAEAALHNRGACVVIGGEPGIGKTTLVEALSAEVSARGVDVAWGKAWEDGGAPPFWPFIQVLRALIDRHGLERMKRASGASWPELAGLLARALDGAEPAGPRVPSGESARNRFRLFDAFSRLLRALCADSTHARPQLIIIEDLHACDEASLSLLRYLSRELSGAALLIVATYRDVALAQLPALRALVDAMPPAQRLQLSALQPHDSALLLAKNLSEPPSQRLAACVHELSEGNPLCIAELARHISQGNLPRLSGASSLDTAVPERIGQAVRMQLSSLPAETVAALTCASAFGRSFTQPVLAQLLAVSELQLLERLAPALSCGIVRASSSAAAELCFAHALVRNAIYAELASHRRAQLHQSIAELLEQRADPALVPVFELAHHYHLAACSGGRLKAIEFAVRAAGHAAEMRAFEASAELYERAFALSTLEGVPSQELLSRATSAGVACYMAGQLAQAVSYFDRAAEIARKLKAYPELALAVGSTCFVLRGTLMFDRARHQHVREALRALPDGDSAIKAMLLAIGTLGESAQDPLVQRRAAAHQGIAMARRLGDPTVLVRALSSGHLALWGSVPPDELAAIANELVAVSRAVEDGEMLLDALLWRILDSFERCDVDTMEADSSEYLTLLDAHHSGWHRYMVAILQSMQESCHGNFADADALSLRAAELGEQQREPSARSFYAVRQLFRWLDGRVECVDGCELDPPWQLPAAYHPLWLLAWVRCGRERQARSALAIARSRGFEHIPLSPLRKPTLAVYALCACELDDLDSAEELYRALLEFDGQLIVLQPGVCVGPTAYFLAVLAAKLERASSAARHFEAALLACQTMRSRSGLWRVQQDYARMLIQAARRASTPLTQAATAGHGLHAPHARAEQLLAQARSLSEELNCEPWRKQTLELTRELQRLQPRLTQVAG